MTMLVELLTDAYIKNGILAAGEILDPTLADYGMRESNRQLDQWNIQANFVWTTSILTFPLTALPTILEPDKTWYTIGPSGADFTAPRPTRIERANLLLESSSPASRVPLTIYNDMQWSDQTVPALGTTIPTSIYDDYGDPNSRLYVWPYPTVTQNQLELFVWNQISRFAATTDTFQMPPGYEDAFVLTMAVRLTQGIREPAASLVKAASLARANVQSLNSQSPKMGTTDSGMPGRHRSLGNFYNGWPVTL